MDWVKLTATLALGTLLASCASAPEPAPTPGPEVTTPTSSPPPPPTPAPIAAMSSLFPEKLVLCPLMNVQNKPDGTNGLEITSYTQFADVKGKVRLARAPVEKACFSSGYGLRARGDGSNKLHKGIDLHNATPVKILAAGDGEVRQVISDAGYGQFVIIDHGAKVFTRYAHLASYTAGLVEGTPVKAGDVIGMMGTTPAVPIHLHYEVLTGNWLGGSSASYLLDPIDIMAEPAAN